MGETLSSYLTKEKMAPSQLTTYVLFTGLFACILHALLRLTELIRKRLRDAEALKEFPGPPGHWLYGNLKEIIQNPDKILDYSLIVTQLFPSLCKLRFGPFLVHLRVHHPDSVRTITSTTADRIYPQKGKISGVRERMLMSGDILGYQAKLAKDYHTACTFHMGPRTQLRIFHPETLKATLTKEPKDPFTYMFLKPWIGDGLLVSKGHKWARHRRLLTPAFHFDILKPYVTIFSESANVMVAKWHRMLKKEDKPIELFESVSLMTLDSLMKCIFGFKGDCQKEGYKHPYIQGVYELAELITQRFRFFPYHNDLVYHLSWSGYKFRRACRTVHTYSKQVIQEKKTERMEAEKKGVKVKSKYLDFLDMLLDARDEDGQGLSDVDIQAEVDTFMFEGHDTTASGISWCLYNLAMHPEYQSKCRDEVNSVLGDKDNFEWDDIHKLSFLNLCVKESLRLHPPVPNVARQTTKPLTFPDGRSVPEKIWLGISIYGVHHNPDIWENPEVYDPYRFTPENSKGRSPHAYVPFSAGPRNCIGQHFALHEIKASVGLVIRQFELSEDTDHVPVKIPQLVLRSKGGLYIKVKSIE